MKLNKVAQTVAPLAIAGALSCGGAVSEVRSAVYKSEHMQAIDDVRNRYAFVVSHAMKQNYQDSPILLDLSNNGVSVSGKETELTHIWDDGKGFSRRYDIDGEPWYLYASLPPKSQCSSRDYTVKLCIDSIDGKNVPSSERCEKLEKVKNEGCEFSVFAMPEVTVPVITEENWGKIKSH